MRLVVATTNPNKFREIRALLAGSAGDGGSGSDTGRTRARPVSDTGPTRVRPVSDPRPHDLQPDRWELVSLAEWPDLVAPEETGRTFEENARLKARYYANATGELVVAEDSGLEVDALNGAPGVESARYGGADTSYPEKFAMIYAALAKAGVVRSPARFVCALALVRGHDVLFETRGIVEGEIAREPAGTGGFGYDPIFFYPPYARTLGEATAEEKSAVSHRGQAFRRLREFLVST